MSSASIIAFLAFLSAFNVPTSTVQQVSVILHANQQSTTQVIATTTLQATPSGDTTLSTNPTPQQTQQPTFGGIIIPVDKSEIVIQKQDYYKDTSVPGAYGEWDIAVAVLDKDGKTVKFAPILLDNPDTPFAPNTALRNSNTIADEGAWRDADGGLHDGPEGIWHHTFAVYFKSVGSKTITFTSGSLSKSITINVQ